MLKNPTISKYMVGPFPDSSFSKFAELFDIMFCICANNHEEFIHYITNDKPMKQVKCIYTITLKIVRNFSSKNPNDIIQKILINYLQFLCAKYYDLLFPNELAHAIYCILPHYTNASATAQVTRD